jgi:hypothetical protein
MNGKLLVRSEEEINLTRPQTIQKDCIVNIKKHLKRKLKRCQFYNKTISIKLPFGGHDGWNINFQAYTSTMVPVFYIQVNAL